MECPDCGYSKGPFEKECTRCASYKARGELAPLSGEVLRRRQAEEARQATDLREADEAKRALEQENARVAEQAGEAERLRQEELKRAAEPAQARGKALEATQHYHWRRPKRLPTITVAQRPARRFVVLPEGSLKDERHPVGLVALAALFLPGVGQMANGQVWKGLFFLIFTAGLGWEMGINAWVGLQLVMLVDAAQIATRKWRGEEVSSWQFF